MGEQISRIGDMGEGLSMTLHKQEVSDVVQSCIDSLENIRNRLLAFRAATIRQESE